MTKHIFFPIVLVAIFIAIVGIFATKYSKPDLNSSQAPHSQKTVEVSGNTINIEVANTEALREKGLSERDSLNENSGMLFVFPQKGIAPSFWMKGMKFNIDIIWIGGNKVVDITKDATIPKEGAPDSSLSLYKPNSPIDYVLEVNANYSSSHNIKIGDEVKINGL